MDAMKPIIAKLATGATLSRAEAEEAFGHMLSGETTQAQTAAFLMGLRVRGETIDEITGAVSAMRSRMLRVEAPDDAIDIVGTGGDHSGSYNVSTLAALIVASAGVPVAKHGNRALSSRSGAADVLTALGVKIGLDPEAVTRCIREAGVGFMFAPAHHASMRHVGPVRVELGIRTVFNLLGPLSNPASVKRQLVGAFAAEWLEPMAEVLKSLGSTDLWMVHGSDGLDEITTTGPSDIIELKNGLMRRFTLSPEDAGLARVDSSLLKGGNAEHNAAALMSVLKGEKTPYRDIALINAGASLVVANRAKDIKDGVAIAAHAIDTGATQKTLTRLIDVSNA
jgi:anthranilate phosphoribosyltransferase